MKAGKKIDRRVKKATQAHKERGQKVMSDKVRNRYAQGGYPEPGSRKKVH